MLCLDEADARLIALEGERCLQEFDTKGKKYWLLILQRENGDIVAASVIDASWFDIRQWNPDGCWGTLSQPGLTPIVQSYLSTTTK